MYSSKGLTLSLTQTLSDVSAAEKVQNIVAKGDMVHHHNFICTQILDFHLPLFFVLPKRFLSRRLRFVVYMERVKLVSNVYDWFQD